MPIGGLRSIGDTTRRALYGAVTVLCALAIVFADFRASLAAATQPEPAAPPAPMVVAPEALAAAVSEAALGPVSPAPPKALAPDARRWHGVAQNLLSDPDPAPSEAADAGGAAAHHARQHRPQPDQRLAAVDPDLHRHHTGPPPAAC